MFCVFAHLQSNLAKIAYMEKLNKLIWVSENAELLADFKFVVVINALFANFVCKGVKRGISRIFKKVKTYFFPLSSNLR